MTAAEKKLAAEAAKAAAAVVESPIAEPLMMKVTKVGKSLKESRVQAPYYFIVEANQLVDINEVIGTKTFQNTIELSKSFFIWATSPWEEIEVGESFEADKLARVFRLKL
jgi:hemoglobin-like flavoprotein